MQSVLARRLLGADPQQLGVSYRSAWLVEHKIMQAMRLRYRISNASW